MRTPLDEAGRVGIRQSAPRPKRRSRFLTYRERMLIKCLSQGMSVTRAALKAGYSDQNPGQSGYQALKAIREKAPELLDRHGLTDDVLIEKHLKPMLSATRTAFVKHKGKITHEREVVAGGPRIASLKLVFRIRGTVTLIAESNEKNEEVKSAVYLAFPEIIFRHIVKGSSNAWRVVVTRSPEDRPVGGYSPLFGRCRFRKGHPKPGRMPVKILSEGLI